MRNSRNPQLGLWLCGKLLNPSIASTFLCPILEAPIVVWVSVQDFIREQLCGAKELKGSKPKKSSVGFCLQRLGPRQEVALPGWYVSP